jgi:hypothetical protein
VRTSERARELFAASADELVLDRRRDEAAAAALEAVDLSDLLG